MRLPLSRTEIAECLSLRLETVSRQFAQLKARGIVETTGRRSFHVRDMAACEATAKAQPSRHSSRRCLTAAGHLLEAIALQQAGKVALTDPERTCELRAVTGIFSVQDFDVVFA